MIEMKEIIFVTGNEGKFRSACRHLNGYDITLKQEKVEIIEPQAKEVREVAEKKIIQIIGKFEKPIMVDDSGLYVYALNGFPGALMKWLLKDNELEKICRMLDPFERGAVARTGIGYRRDSSTPQLHRREYQTRTCYGKKPNAH